MSAPPGEAFDQAAIRHYQDAVRLAADARFDNAGQLTGISAECSIKYTFAFHGTFNDNLRHHLPNLALIALKNAQGRIASQKALINLLNQTRGTYFSDWDISHRYAADGTTKKAIFQKWQTLAHRTLCAANLRES